MLQREPEYRRRRRQETEDNERNANRECNEAAVNSNIEKIVRAIRGVVQKLDAAEDLSSSKNKPQSREKWFEILGLWAAAAVGVCAIIFGNLDASRQRAVMLQQIDKMQTQVDIMRADQRPWLGMGFVGYPPDQPFQLQFINGGKSPAFDVAIIAYVWQHDDTGHPLLPGVRCTTDCKVDGIGLLPGIPFQMVLLRQEGPFGPNNGRTFQDIPGWIIGRADYKDSAGAPHKTGVCLYHSPATHGLVSCPIPGSNYAD